LVLGGISLQAQDTIQLNNIITGKLTVVAKKQVVLTPGFIAMDGSKVLIYTDGNLDESSIVSIPTMDAVTDTIIPVSSVSEDQNYIRAITFFEANSSESISEYEIANIKHAEDIQYYDGLGRLRQTIQVAASPNGFDIVQPTVYDGFGRMSKQFLPYVSKKANGSFQTTDTSDCYSFYGTDGNIIGRVGESMPFATTNFDNSPLNRVVEQYGAGASWYENEKSTKIKYATNSSNITLWDEMGEEVSYKAGTLYVTRTTDENDRNTTTEYMDKLGQVVMKVSVGDGDSLRTAYVYDDLGLLRTVVPPLAESPDDKDLCYYYTYDGRHRMITKKIPGADIVQMVYDKRDRLVLTQDGVMRDSSMYLFTKYDALNRPVMTGKTSLSDDIDQIRSKFNDDDKDDIFETFNASNASNSSAVYLGYSLNNSFPSGYEVDTANILTVFWYDGYSYLSLDCAKSCSFSNYTDLNPTYRSTYSAMTKGMVTGAMVKVFPVDAEAKYDLVNSNQVTASYYDDYGNVIRTVSYNFKGGYDIALTNYEPITYRAISTSEVHKSSADDKDAIIITKGYTYDHMGRLLQTTCQVNNQSPVVLSASGYNELGELAKKYLHAEDTDISKDSREFVQRVDYDYNIRGWLTSINDPSLKEDNDVFGMRLYYNQTSDISTASALYNGNISAMTWAVADDDAIGGYTFEYDGFNRLRNASYGEGLTLSSNAGLYNESISSYDNNGNILALSRYHNGIPIDDLVYKYFEKSNKLKLVEDVASEHDENIKDFENPDWASYDYDANGNMTIDGPKDNTVDYNFLNLPQKIDYKNDGEYKAYYLYDAAGTKLAKLIRDKDASDYQTTEYLGPLVYNGGNLSFIQTEEGRMLPIKLGSDTVWHFEYNLKDHLGNVRLVFGGSLNSGGVDIVQTSSYYPFGMIMNQVNYISTTTNYPKNKYLYNGKELQNEDLDGESLDWYDYGARMYDPSVVHWTTLDPKSELSRKWSPYSYCYSNPIRFIDPDGTFVLDSATQADHPLLADYYKNLLDNWNAKSDDFKNAFYELSGLNESEVEEMLTFGNGPKIEIEDLDKIGTNGKPDQVNGATLSLFVNGKQINENNGQGLIKIDNDLVTIYEQGQMSGDESLNQHGEMLIESTTFHEGVHFGSIAKRGSGGSPNYPNSEIGKVFEKMIYNMDVNRLPVAPMPSSCTN